MEYVLAALILGFFLGLWLLPDQTKDREEFNAYLHDRYGNPDEDD